MESNTSAGILKGSITKAGPPGHGLVFLEGVDPGTTLGDLESVFASTAASSWALHFDRVVSGMTLEVRFAKQEDADSYIANHTNAAIKAVLGLRPALHDYRRNSVVTSSTTDGIDTPHSTTAAGPLSETASTVGLDSDTIPWPGRTYRIQHRSSGRMITLVEGRLQLQLPETTKGAGGWHWVCVETNGWLGFRSPVSGTYMGHNERGRIMAGVSHHRAYEHFCVRRHPEAGYVILIKQRNGLELLPVAFDEKSGGLVEKKDGDDQWLFEVV